MEDVYVFIRGFGWVVVDDEPVSVRPEICVAVDQESARFVRAGPEGLDFLAICG